MVPLPRAAEVRAAPPRKPGTVTAAPKISMVTAPPTVQSTTMKVAAESTAVVSPIARSTGLGRNPRVVGDATFGVAVRPAGEIELVAAAVAQPAIKQALVEPGTPAPLHGHA